MTATSLKTFYRLIATQAMSLIGSQMTSFAIGIWLFQETGQATPLLMVSVFEFLPNVLAGSVAGVLADRWNRKTILVLTDAGQALPTFFLMLTFLAGTFALWQLYLAVLIGAVFRLLQQAAFSASVAMLVPENELDRANTLRQLAMPAAGLLAPIFAGFLYTLIGVTGIIVIDLTTFFIAVFIVSQQTIPQPDRSEQEKSTRSILSDMKNAFGFLWERPALLTLIFYATFINFSIVGPLNLATPYILTITGEEKLLGIMQGLLNLGLVVGGITFSMMKSKGSRVKTALGGVLFLAIMLMIYGVARHPIVLGITLFFLLSTIPMINASFASMTQLKTPPEMHGRIFALMGQLSVFATPLSLVLTGFLVDHILEPAVNEASWWGTVAPIVGNEAGAGMGLLMIFGGLMVMVVGSVVYSLPMVRNVERNLPDYTPQSFAPEPSLGNEALAGGGMAPAPLQK